MKLISISEAARLTGRDRKTVKKATEGLESFPGPKNATRYRSTQLLQRIYVGDGDGITYPEALRRLAVAREALATTQNKELSIKVAEKTREMITVDDSMKYWEYFAVYAKAEIDTWPEPYRMRAYFKLQECVNLSANACGVDVTKDEAELDLERRKFEEEFKAGRVPIHWAEHFRPENDKRVWSEQLNRYYTKAEIIAKFGPGTQISPIDEILAEAAEMNGETAV